MYAQFFLSSSGSPPKNPSSGGKLPTQFNPTKSKYSVEREEENINSIVQRKNSIKGVGQQAQRVPEYLVDEQNLQDQLKLDYETKNPEDLKELARIEREAQLGSAKNNKEETSLVSTAQIAAQLDRKKRLDTFDRFNEDFVSAYMADRYHKTLPEKNKAMQQEQPLTDFIGVANADEFSKTERLTKRLARMGVCSRRQAEKLIEQGMVKVDGKLIDKNMQVSSSNLIQVSAKTGMYTPVKESTRVWLFNKPQRMVTTHRDPQGRVTVFERLKDLGLHIPHVISVGRLDYLSEGLLIVTNDGDLARALEIPNFQVERSYRVRVFGRMFDEAKLNKIRKGFFMNGRKYGPYICDIENRQNTNTWLHMKLYEGKNNEIRRVMRKFSLRVNRLQRVRYGPYTLGEVPEPNDMKEVPLLPQIRRILFHYYKERTQAANQMVREAQDSKTLQETNKAFKEAAKTRSIPESREDDESDQDVEDERPKLKGWTMKSSKELGE